MGFLERWQHNRDIKHLREAIEHGGYGRLTSRPTGRGGPSPRTYRPVVPLPVVKPGPARANARRTDPNSVSKPRPTSSARRTHRPEVPPPRAWPPPRPRPKKLF